MVEVTQTSELSHNPDAQAWARAYKATFPDADEHLMLGWFANAIMAMHDYLLFTEEGQAKVEHHRTSNSASSDVVEAGDELTSIQLLDRFNQKLAQRENCDTCTTYSGKIQEIGALFCDNRSVVRKALQALSGKSSAMREDDVAELLNQASAPYAKNKGSSGLTAWCKAHGVNKSHASEFVNRKRRPGGDLLAALGLEVTYTRAALNGEKS